MIRANGSPVGAAINYRLKPHWAAVPWILPTDAIIDFDKGLIRFPPARTNSNLEHLVPMSDPVQAIFKKRKRVVGPPYCTFRC